MVTVMIKPVGLWVNVESMEEVAKNVVRLQQQMDENGSVTRNELLHMFELDEFIQKYWSPINLLEKTGYSFTIYPLAPHEHYDDDMTVIFVVDYLKVES